MGFPCTATVPTWFTDSPTTCPIPCWYPALKPTTGAANQGTCAVGIQDGTWRRYRRLECRRLTRPGSHRLSSQYDICNSRRRIHPRRKHRACRRSLSAQQQVLAFWWEAAGHFDARTNDESAFAISRNNGETWNQLSLIDTTIDWFNDVAVAPDCTTIYLASVNRNLAIAGYVQRV